MGFDIVGGLGGALGNLSEGLMLLERLKRAKERETEDTRRFDAGMTQRETLAASAETAAAGRQTELLAARGTESAADRASAESIAELERTNRSLQARLDRLERSGITFTDPDELNPELVGSGFGARADLGAGETATFEGPEGTAGGMARGDKRSVSESTTTVISGGKEDDPRLELLRAINPQLATFGDNYNKRLSEELDARYPNRALGVDVPEEELQALKQQVMNELANDWRKFGGPLPADWVQLFGLLELPVPKVEFDQDSTAIDPSDYSTRR